MAYQLPTFNLSVKIWRGPVTVFPPPGTPIVTVGNLTPGRRIVAAGTTVSTLGDVMYLLLPKNTDIRSLACAGSADVVEVPSGTGRYYNVEFVDDIAKGFAN